MKKILTLFPFFCFAVATFAQTEIKLWPGAVPDEKSPKHPAVLRDTLHKVTRVTDISDPLVTVYKPKGKSSVHAGIIVSPGGGNKYLAIDIEGIEIANWLNSLGYTAFVLQYRVPLNPTGALEDGQRAVRLVRSMAAKYDISTDRIGVMGFSAGGNLSARISTNYNVKLYKPVDKADSLSARPDFALLIYPGSLSVGDDHKLIPEIPVTAQTPPFFVFVASDDQYGPPLSLAQAVRAVKLPIEFHIVPKGGHGYGLRKGNPAAEAWPSLAEKWLENILK